MRFNLVYVMQQETVFPDKNSDKGKREQVQEMFDTISPAYDDLNRVMTLRMDISWRKNVRQYVAKKNPGTILDIATGTGDLAIELSKIPSAEITAVDISQGMLSVGEKKVKSLGLTDRIHMQVADSENLPFPETSIPTRFPYKQGYKFYTKFIVPLMGRLLAKNKNAYAYLSESAAKFPFGKQMAQILSQEIGFTSVNYKPQTLGVATIYIADK